MCVTHDARGCARGDGLGYFSEKRLSTTRSGSLLIFLVFASFLFDFSNSVRVAARVCDQKNV